MCITIAVVNTILFTSNYFDCCHCHQLLVITVGTDIIHIHDVSVVVIPMTMVMVVMMMMIVAMYKEGVLRKNGTSPSLPAARVVNVVVDYEA